MTSRVSSLFGFAEFGFLNQLGSQLGMAWLWWIWIALCNFERLDDNAATMAGKQQQQEKLQLHVVTGAMQGTLAEFPVKKKVTIGRTRVNAFPIKHDTVSQRHAFIVFKNGQWLVTDSNSSNGTTVNGVVVATGVPTELRNGDRLGIGPENEVSVKIISAQDEEEEEGKHDVEVGGDGEEERRKQAELSSRGGLILKEWLEQEQERLARDSESLAEIAIRKMVEEAEAAKKEIYAAAGEEYRPPS